MTGRHVPKIEKLVVEHCSGNVLRLVKRKDREETSVIGQRDPKEEQEAKMKRREANRLMAEKMRKRG